MAVHISALFEKCTDILMEPDLVLDAKRSSDTPTSEVEAAVKMLRACAKEARDLCQNDIPAGEMHRLCDSLG